MKTNSLPVLSFLAALAGLVLLPLSVPAAAVAVTVTGLLPILAADYGRTVGRPQLRAPVLPFTPSRTESAGCLAAA